MTIKGKRIFNYRPTVFFAVALIFGILVAEALYTQSVWWYLALFIVIIGSNIAVVAVKKSRRFFYISLAVLVGFVSMTATNLQYNSVDIKTYSGTFTAQVSSEILYENGKASFYLDNITTSEGALEYSACAKCSIYADDIDFSAGDFVTVKGTIKYRTHERFSTFYSSYVSSGVRYNASVSSIKKLSDGKLKFPDNLQVKIKRILYENTDDYTASVSQALVLGDKFGIDDDLYDNIKASGLAHVLAVSGLHVSTLAAALYFVLKKLKVNPKIGFVVVLVLTFLYSMLCSFTASSLRAVIMCGVSMFASSFGRKRDDLSSLSLAAILILIFRPCAIADIGFLLSFASVAGIFMFARPFERIGDKIVNKISPKRRIGRRFASVCAISFATNLASYPFVAYFFGEVPVLFILSNFLILPYIMAVYVAMLVLTTLSVITGWGGFVWILKYLLLPFRLYVKAIGSLPFATVNTVMGLVGMITSVIMLILASRFVFLNKVQRGRALSFTATAGLVASMIVAVCV